MRVSDAHDSGQLVNCIFESGAELICTASTNTVGAGERFAGDSSKVAISAAGATRRTGDLQVS